MPILTLIMLLKIKIRTNRIGIRKAMRVKNSDISVGVNLSWTAVAITLVCSMVLGVICETMPVKHATKLESIVAFRQ